MRDRWPVRVPTWSARQGVPALSGALIVVVAACSGALLQQVPRCWGERDVNPGIASGVLQKSPLDPFRAELWLVLSNGQGLAIGWPDGFTTEGGPLPERHLRIFEPPADAGVVFAEEGDTVQLVGGLHANGESFFICSADGPNGHWPGPGQTAAFQTPG